MKVYVSTEGRYADMGPRGVFSTLELAFAACPERGRHGPIVARPQEWPYWEKEYEAPVGDGEICCHVEEFGLNAVRREP